uniref:formylglycine-generating enzyme family protein n=1 Tax=Luteococcus sp. TaxID=1969402 RepID=UPI003735BB18
MGIRMIPVPPRGAVDEVVVDRRTGESWTVRVEPFELAQTVVTCGQWDQTLGLPGDAAFAGHPRTGVSWREAITFCNRLSIREGLEPVYEVSQRIVAEPTQWRPHSEPRPDDWDVVWNHHADGYRLPSDAEWQVACRAGTTGARYGALDAIGWYAGNSGG